MFLQDAPHVQQRGRRAIAAIEQAVGMRVLPARDGLGVGGQAMLGDVALLLALVGFGRRPGLGQQQRMQRSVAGVLGQGTAIEGLGIAVQVDVALVGARNPRKAIRIDRVHQQQGHAGIARARQHRRIVQQASWQPEPQKPSAPCVADVMISSRSALASPISATSVDRASSRRRAPRSDTRPCARPRLGGGKKALARLSVAVGKIADCIMPPDCRCHARCGPGSRTAPRWKASR